jgi:hypothetical protein
VCQPISEHKIGRLIVPAADLRRGNNGSNLVPLIPTKVVDSDKLVGSPEGWGGCAGIKYGV